MNQYKKVQCYIFPEPARDTMIENEGQNSWRDTVGAIDEARKRTAVMKTIIGENQSLLPSPGHDGNILPRGLFPPAKVPVHLLVVILTSTEYAAGSTVTN